MSEETTPKTDGSSKPCLEPLKVYPEAEIHDEKLTKLFDNIYIIKGQIGMDLIPGYVTMKFSRLMTIIKNPMNNELTLINSMRLNEQGLKQLDELGKVKNIIKLAGFHGKDDPFYKDRYAKNNITIYAPKPTDLQSSGSCKHYALGTDPKSYVNDEIPKYLEPDELFDESFGNKFESMFPDGYKVKPIIYKSPMMPEALLLVETTDSKMMISGDSIQNYMSTNGDEYSNFLGKWMMWAAGFLKPCNIGPPWYQGCKPDKKELLQLLEHKFDSLIPGHGDPYLVTESSENDEPAYKKLEPNIVALPQY